MNRILLLFTAVFCPLFNKLKQIVLSFLQGDNQDNLLDKTCSLRTFAISLVLLFTVSFANATDYYSKSTGNLNLTATWGTNTDGSGTAPSNFTTAGNVFYIRNNAAPTIGASWTVSGRVPKLFWAMGQLLVILLWEVL